MKGRCGKSKKWDHLSTAAVMFVCNGAVSSLSGSAAARDLLCLLQFSTDGFKWRRGTREQTQHGGRNSVSEVISNIIVTVGDLTCPVIMQRSWWVRLESFPLQGHGGNFMWLWALVRVFIAWSSMKDNLQELLWGQNESLPWGNLLRSALKFLWWGSKLVENLDQ